MINQNTKIYVDLDGVLADFDGAKAKLNVSTGDVFRHTRLINNWWLSLNKLSNADRLLEFISKYGDYYILSKPSNIDPASWREKPQWVQKNASIKPIKTILSLDKSTYAINPDQSANILIDDWQKNIKKWNDAGGIGLLYRNDICDKVMHDLSKIMNGTAS